ncbi:uncharacterized protein LOC144115899 [Amblyomma americanum]
MRRVFVSTTRSTSTVAAAKQEKKAVTGMRRVFVSSIINRTMVATCSWFSGHGKSKKTGVSEFKVEKAMYDTVKGIPMDAVFHKRTAIPIWSTEAVVLCSSSGKCSGGDSGRHCGYTAGVKLLSGKFNLFNFARKDARYDARGLHLDYTASFVYQ